MPSPSQKLIRFAQLHSGPAPLVLVNVWDAGSARAVAAVGASAIATGSASVAAALGHDDGEATPLNAVLDNATRIVRAVDLPVSLDFEAGYADDEPTLAQNIVSAVGTGIVGINFEDGCPSAAGSGMRGVEESVSRLCIVRRAANSALGGFWINARTDICLNAPADQHKALVAEIIERGRAYAAAGASSYFVPGLRDLPLIRQVCEAVPLPVNIMAGPTPETTDDLARAGVRRISYGPFPWRAAMASLVSFAEKSVSGR